MAIFTGTWEDGDGVPFDASAQVLHDQPGGGYVAAKRFRRCKCNQSNQNRWILGYLQNRWFNVLSSSDRSWWENFGWTWARGDSYPRITPYPGWNRFVSAAYAEVWYFGWTTLKAPSYQSTVPFARGIDAVNYNNQTITINVIYNSAFGTNPHSMMIWYQMKPVKSKEPTCWRDTRMINIITNWDPNGGSFTYAVPARFRLEEGRSTRCIIRVRPGPLYEEDYSSNYSIPYP